MDAVYEPAKALTIISGIFLLLGGVCGLIVLSDIIIRQGWKSMMGVMIPTYPITACYTGPLGLYLYFKYGRAKKPSQLTAGAGHDHQHKDHAAHSGHENHMEHANQGPPGEKSAKASEGLENHGAHVGHEAAHETAGHEHMTHSSMDHTGMDHSTMNHLDHEGTDHSKMNQSQHNGMDHSHMHHDAVKDLEAGADHTNHTHHKHTMGAGLPNWAIILIGVSHCGAGCVLGDLVGEWIIYGSGATINGRDTWPCLLLDYGFALLAGIFFQYFSIAPMSGEWGPRTVWRAAKADILSLTSFEIGLFGWMVAYQVGIWPDLMMTSWLYWWQMQVGMFLGYLTAIPINWLLILTWKIKEPCV